MYIYKITNIITNKSYIGLDTKNVNLLSRWKSHKMSYLKHRGRSKLYNSMNKHGVENFKCEVIDTATTTQELRDKEEYWIKILDTCNNGYNILPSANGGWTLSDMSENDRINKTKDCRKGMIKLNSIKWSINNPNITEYKKQAKQALNDFYLTVDRSKKVKENWENLSPEDRFNKSNGIRNYWNSLSKIEKSEKALIGSLKALETNAKRYHVIDKFDNIYYVIGLGLFCKERNLSLSSMQKLSVGKLEYYDGWKCYKIDKITNKFVIPEKFIPKKTGPKPKPKLKKIFHLVSPENQYHKVDNIRKITIPYKLSTNKLMDLFNNKIQYYKGWKIDITYE